MNILYGKAFVIISGITLLVFSAFGHAVQSQTTILLPTTASTDQNNSDGMMDGVNPQRTRVYRTKGVHQLGSLARKSEKLFDMNYRKTLRPDFDGSLYYTEIGFSDPFIANGLIYFKLSNGRNYLLALDANTGRGIWKFNLDKEFLSTAAAAGELIYVGASDGNFYALDGRTGQEKWKYSSKGQSFSHSSPAVVDGVVYFSSLSGNLYAVDTQTKQAKWIFKAKGILSPPAFTSEAVYFGSENDLLYVVDIQTGQEKWRFKANNKIGTPVIADGAVYFRTDKGDLYALDIKTGEQKWKAHIGEPVPGVIPITRIKGGSSLAIAEGTIFFGSSKNLYAVDAKTGKTKWEFEIKSPCRSPIIADGVIYFGGMGKFYAVDAVAGKEKWVLGSNDPNKKIVTSSPTIKDGVIYFVTDEGFLFAVQ